MRVIRRVTAVKKSGCCVVSSADSSSNFDSMPNKPNKRRNLPDVEPSDSDSFSTDWERGVLPDIISRPSVRIMRAMVSRSCGMVAGGRPNAHRGQGMRGLPPTGCGTAMAVARAALYFGRRGRGSPWVSVRGYVPRRCGLCRHDHIFDTRSGLIQHAIKLHHSYYSLSGDCFRPIPEADLQVYLQKREEGQHHNWPYGAGRPSRGRGRGRGRALVPLPPRSGHHERSAGGDNDLLLNVQAGVLPVWLRPRMPALDTDSEADIADKPEAPAATPPPVDVAPPVEFADLPARLDTPDLPDDINDPVPVILGVEGALTLLARRCLPMH